MPGFPETFSLCLSTTTPSLIVHHESLGLYLHNKNLSHNQPGPSSMWLSMFLYITGLCVKSHLSGCYGVLLLSSSDLSHTVSWDHENGGAYSTADGEVVCDIQPSNWAQSAYNFQDFPRCMIVSPGWPMIIQIQVIQVKSWWENLKINLTKFHNGANSSGNSSLKNKISRFSQTCRNQKNPASKAQISQSFKWHKTKPHPVHFWRQQ